MYVYLILYKVLSYSAFTTVWSKDVALTVTLSDECPIQPDSNARLLHTLTRTRVCG